MKRQSMRLLALVPPGTNSRSQFIELLRGATLAGHTVVIEDVALFMAEVQKRHAAGAPIDQTRTLYARYLEGMVREHRIDAVITIWIDPLTLLPIVPNTGRESSFLEVLGIRCFHWWLDAPFWAYAGRALGAFANGRFTGVTHTHVINNPGTADEMRRVLALRAVVAQPYGVDPASFRPWPLEREYDLAVNAGPGDPPPTPTMLRELDRDEPDTAAIRQDLAARALPAVRAAIEPAFGAAASQIAERWVQEQVNDPDRPMLAKFDAACGADAPDRTALTAQPQAWATATAALRTIDNWQRAFTAAYLSRRFRTLIIGPVDWDRSGWPITGDRTGPVLYHELAVAYSRCRLGLNVMRYQDDVGLNPKALEVAASGTVLLQRWRAGFDDTFADGREAVSFRSPQEAARHARELLAHPDRLAAVSAAGRTRVLAEHTWCHKARHLFGAGEREPG